MPVARNPGSTSLVDILDRILDQGIRFEQGPRAALTGARAPTEQGRIVVAAVETHLHHPEAPPGKTGTGA
jgi:gas vesicle structural protein